MKIVGMNYNPESINEQSDIYKDQRYKCIVGKINKNRSILLTGLSGEALVIFRELDSLLNSLRDIERDENRKFGYEVGYERACYFYSKMTDKK